MLITTRHGELCEHSEPGDRAVVNVYCDYY